MREQTTMQQAKSTAAALLCLSVAAACNVSGAKDPVHRWTLTQEHVQGQTIVPVHGHVSATLAGGAEFSREKPYAIQLSGTQPRTHLLVTDDLSNASLPSEQLTADAWVRIDRHLEWGGICGAIQDNGDFERGWLLGYRKDRFFFAVASETRKRLTYLMAPTVFEVGYWYHVAGTYDGKTLTLFIDGKTAATSQEQSGPIAYPPSASLVIGSYLDDDEYHPMTGQIEQVSIYDECLTKQRVAEQFSRRSPQFPEVEAIVPQVTGWPTYLRDNQRTGLSHEELDLPLKKLWTWQAAAPPQPAWPPPAKTDFWHRKHNLQPRVVFDRAFHTVSEGNDVFFATSSDCRVVCLDAQTGHERWSFYADAPVRLAPTIVGDDIIFGGDDGIVRSLKRRDGAINWEYRFAEIPERWIPGNQRIMSSMPIRSGILVEDDVAWFCAGLFPSQGVFQIAIDVRTGKKLAHAGIGVSAQGYLERRSGRLYVPAARNPAGAFAANLSRRGKGVGRTINTLPEEFRYAFVGAKDVRIGGGRGRVAIFREQDGKQIWSAAVEGTAWGLAVADGRLLVSTDAGLIYAFGPQDTAAAESTGNEERAATDPLSDNNGHDIETKVKRVLAEAGTSQGYCLVTECRDGSLARELARQSEFRIVALFSSRQQADAARSMLANEGLYGRVTVQHRIRTNDLPFTDYMFNLIASERIVRGTRSEADVAEIRRMLRPGTGFAFLGGGNRDIIRREPLAGIGEWTHMYADPGNTACSSDTRVTGRMHLQWFGEPGPRDMINRHHRTVAPLFRSGRLFVPGNDQIFAVDAYNGTLLWTRKVPNSRRIAAFRDCSNMAAGQNHVFMAAEDRCFAFHPQTGYVEHEYTAPRTPDGGPREWGYVATVGHRLFGSGAPPGSSRREHTRESIIEGAYYDAREVVCSDSLFAFDTDSTAQEWNYEARTGAIINSTLTVGSGFICFVESGNADTLSGANGRHALKTLVAGAHVVALDSASGNELLRVPAGVSTAEHNLYLQTARNKLILVGSRNSGTDKNTARVVYEIRVFDAASGELAWQTAQVQSTKIRGDHGEQDLHPVVVGDRLYCEPKAYQLHSGEVIDDWGWKLGKRSGCGNISASASSLFFRQSNPTMFDLASKKMQPVTTSTRPGCLINIIPAGGLLLIPEASSGCTCDYGVQTSLAFLPIADD